MGLESLKKWWIGEEKEPVKPAFASSRPGGSVVARAKGKIQIHARVYRAATGQWETMGLIAEGKRK